MENIIKDYILYDNKIKELYKNISKYKNIKTKLESKIINYIKTNNIKKIQLPKEDIKYTISQHKIPITKSVIYQQINTYFNGSKSQSDKIINFIYNNRDIVQKEMLKRICKKKQ